MNDVDNAYRRYFETGTELAACGIYDGIAHPDSVKLFGHRPSFELLPYYDRLSEALVRTNTYAEQNSEAHRRCPDTAGLGMAADLLRALKKHGVAVLTASDAHRPEDVGEGIPDLMKLTEEI